MKYAKKLKNPLWQKRRLEILNRDKFTCQLCGDTQTELHIHHYVYSGEPWEAPDDKLKTLCKHCHAAITDIDNRQKLDLSVISVVKGDYGGDNYIISVFVSTPRNPLGVFMYFYQESGNLIEFLVVMTVDNIKRISEHMEGLKSVQPYQPPAKADE